MAAPFAVLAVAFMIIFGPWLLPASTDSRTYIPRTFAWHTVGQRSAFLGQPLLDCKLGRVPGAELVWIKRADEEDAHSLPDLKVRLVVIARMSLTEKKKNRRRAPRRT